MIDRSARALVTGAAGFIGSRLAARLAASGETVRAIDCLTDYYDLSQKRAALRSLERIPRCNVVTTDLRTADLDELLEGIEVVFHQAGQPGVRASWDHLASYVEHNVMATERLLRAAAHVGVRRFVFASSSSVYGRAVTYPTSERSLPDPVSPYGVTKLAAEHLCRVYERAWGVRTVSLRYFTVYGPGQRPDMAVHRLIESALSHRPFSVFGDGQQVRDLTFVDDVVEANLLAATVDAPEAATLNIAGGTATSLLDLARLVGELAGHPVDLRYGPPERGDVARTGGSIELAARVLGWRPHVSLEEGLASQVAWHVARSSVPV
jgi:UDP-glucuronate 4-epimerase